MKTSLLDGMVAKLISGVNLCCHSDTLNTLTTVNGWQRLNVPAGGGLASLPANLIPE
jgi:hypothetical protein